MKSIHLIVFIYLTTASLVFPAEKAGDDNSKIKSAIELSYEAANLIPPKPQIDFESRKTKAVIFSALIPGSGQSYLGNEITGAGYTIAFFGTALTALIAQNNMTGREDRIKILTADYQNSGNFDQAERVWRQIEFEKGNRDNDYKRRQLFTYAAIGVYIINLVDIILLAEDRGADEFAFHLNKGNNSLELNFSQGNNFTGVALKFNLP